MIRILIADDHQMFIDGIRSLLAPETDIEIVAEALNGHEVLFQLSQQSVDMVLMDINMPRLNGLDATKLIKEKYPETRVLMVTMYNTPEYICDLAEAGADGYILKDTGKQELLSAIRTIASGKNFYSQEVMLTMMQNERNKKAKTQNDPQLSKREIEVLKLIAQEFTTQEIADQLFISNHTVETHRKNLLDKVGARNIAGLVKYAILNKLVE